jgi:hypothetical protein
LRTVEGLVDTETGPTSAETARRLACDATLSVLILNGTEPVAAGPARRTVPPAMRRALEARDQHCTHAECDIPAQWCDAHHIVHWADGGTTDLSNLRLLCRRHRRAAHNHAPYPQRE